MRRVLLIHNPHAARHNPTTVGTVETELRRHGCDVRLAAIRAQGDAMRFARTAVECGDTDVIAVYGGDGTMMQAVEGFIDSDMLLGLIPGGTGNLLAGNLKLSRNPKRAAATIANGQVRKIDVGRVESGDDVRYFAVACGAGYDAEVMAGTTGVSKKRWGMGAYVSWILRTVHQVRPHPYRITIDGQSHVLDAATVVVANCREIIPPVLTLGSDVSLDDGLLDVVALKAAGLIEAGWVVLELLSRRRRTTAAVRRLRGRRIRVEAEVEQPVQLDGESVGTTPLTIQVVPRALPVLVANRPSTS